IVNEELAEYINSPSWNRPTFFNDNEEHSVQYKEYLENSSNEIAASNFNQEKENPPQDSNIRQLVREECGIKTQFDLGPHMESPDWIEIDADIQQHLQKANIARTAQNRQNRAKSTIISRQRSRSLARLQDEMRQNSATQEYPLLIDTFFVAHTVNGVFTRDEDRLIYEDMRRLEATGTYTDDEINRLARRGKKRGHIPGVGRVLPARLTASPSRPAPKSTLKSLHKKVDFMMSFFKSDFKFSNAFSQFESAGASGSGGSDGCRDDEDSVDDQEDEDENGGGDSYLCYIL
nr:F-box domain, leucine-rich repeat domain, L domain-like protein [Tanacetum cinerariifolium]